MLLSLGVLTVLFYRNFRDEFGPPGEALRKLIGDQQYGSRFEGMSSALTRSSCGPVPNGLSAASQIAQAGFSVLVLEAKGTVGGGCRWRH